MKKQTRLSPNFIHFLSYMIWVVGTLMSVFGAYSAYLSYNFVLFFAFGVLICACSFMMVGTAAKLSFGDANE